MAQEIITNLMELIDEHYQSFDEWTYMKAATWLSQLYNGVEPEPQPMTLVPAPQFVYVGYGASTQQLAADYHRLTETHNRLKRRNKQRLRTWRQQEKDMRQRIDELMAEVEYLGQYRPRNL